MITAEILGDIERRRGRGVAEKFTTCLGILGSAFAGVR
jgi:hypothetical protein